MALADLSLEELTLEIEKAPENEMLYYYHGTKSLEKYFGDLKSFEEKELKSEDFKSVENIKKDFEKAIELGPGLFMARYYRGVLLLKLDDHLKAEEEFRKVIKLRPDYKNVRKYLKKCFIVPQSKLEGMCGRDILYLFENAIRIFIEEKLGEKYGKKWEKQIPKPIQRECGGKREISFDEEKNLSLAYFAEFTDYKSIFEKNRTFFSSYMNVNKWKEKLNDLEIARNNIAHNRPRVEEAEREIIKGYLDFQEIFINQT